MIILIKHIYEEIINISFNYSIKTDYLDLMIVNKNVIN